MKYVVMLAVAFSCVSFEAECGWGKWLERQGRNFRDGSLKPLERNLIRRPNNEIKRVFSRDIQPWLRSIFGDVENDIQSIEGKITRGETQGVDQAIQTVNLRIDDMESDQDDIVDKIEISESNNSGSVLNKEKIEEELLVVTEEFDLLKSTLEEAKLKKSLRINQANEAHILLSESEKNILDLHIVQARIQKQRKNIEVLHLQSLLKKARPY